MSPTDDQYTVYCSGEGTLQSRYVSVDRSNYRDTTPLPTAEKEAANGTGQITPSEGQNLLNQKQNDSAGNSDRNLLIEVIFIGD